MLFFVRILLAVTVLHASETVFHPFPGVTHIVRVENEPRPIRVHIIRIALDTPGLSFRLTRAGGSRETVRQTTLAYLNQVRAQIAVNAHFFTPYPSADANANLVGFAVSDGVILSGFEIPEQSYALVPNAPALRIGRDNRASIGGRGEAGKPWVALAGSARILTRGRITIPQYRPAGVLVPGGPGNYSNDHSWYDVPNARTIAGLSRGGQVLFLVTVDRAAGSDGITVGDAARLLLEDYGVYDAINLDGGGSTTLVIEDVFTGSGRIVNIPAAKEPGGRSVGSNLAVFVNHREW